MSHHSRHHKAHTSKAAPASPDAHLRSDEKPLTCSPPDAVVIRLRAYEISQARQSDGNWGDADSDWKQAEEEVRATRTSTP